MSKGSTTTNTTAELTPEQRAMIGAQTDLFTSTIAPSYQQAIGGAQDIYNLSSGGVTNAAQNQAAIGAQSQNVLGSTGESALRTGISGLQNLFDPNYEQQQIQAALAPAQAQYQTNLANQQAGFGGAGQLGSARSALAGTALAGSNAAAQQQAAANIQAQIAAQRLSAGGTLAQLGQGGIGQAMGAAGTQVSAAKTPQDFYNQYSSILFGTPQQSYSPNFSGTQGSNVNSTQLKIDPFNTGK